MLRIHFTPRDLARATVATTPAPLQVLDLNDRDLYLDGRGIELQPSAFCRQVPTRLRDPDLTPILVDPIQHASGILRQASMEPHDLACRGSGNTRTSPERTTA